MLRRTKDGQVDKWSIQKKKGLLFRTMSSKASFVYGENDWIFTSNNFFFLTLRSSVVCNSQLCLYGVTKTHIKRIGHQISSVQFKLVYMRSGNSICASSWQKFLEDLYQIWLQNGVNFIGNLIDDRGHFYIYQEFTRKCDI